MKKLIIVLWLALALYGCRTVKKATQSKQQTNSSFSLDNVSVSTELTKIINDRNIVITETTEETEFFRQDTVKSGKTSTDEKRDVKSTKKTVKTTVISDKGTTTVAKKDSTDTSLEGKESSSTETKETVKTKPKTNLLFVGLVVGVVLTILVVLYFNKIKDKVLGFLK